jgi:hypothetical protein
MPELVGATLKSVAHLGWVDELASDQIQVSFPATTAVWSADFDPPGVAVVGERRRTFPARTLSLHFVDNGEQEVVAQSPQAGAPLSAAATVTLDAGAHPNDTGRPWMVGHPLAIQKHGISTCIVGPGGGCHGPTECAQCHESLK